MATRQIHTDLDLLGSSKVTGLPTPTAPSDAVNKAYVDSAIEGLAFKDSARVATQGNINIASPGATIDGIAMAANDRVLVRAQSAASENGVYIWNGAAVPMTRALDASTFDELEQAVISVEEGSSADATFRQTEVNGTLGSSAVTWTSFGTSAPAATETTAGILEIATQAETDAGTDDARAVTPAKLGNWSGRMRRFSQTFGDGSATSYTLTHNFNSRDVQVQVYLNSGNYDEVICEVERGLNAVTLIFNSAPALNAMRAIVQA